MKKIGISVAIAAVIVLVVLAWVTYMGEDNQPLTLAHPDYKNATYTIDGDPVTLVNGVSQMPAVPGSSSTVTVRYFGNEATGDLNGDGKDDIAFLITRSGSGSGTFYYLVAALLDQSGDYTGTNAVLLGDRIAPQTTQIANGHITVNYADRAVGEPMTAKPTIGTSKHYSVYKGQLELAE